MTGQYRDRVHKIGSMTEPGDMMSRAEEPISAKEPDARTAQAGAAVGQGGDIAENPPVIDPSRRWKDQVGVATLACCLLVAATTWYLLKEFAPLLRPLLLAVFLCYVILPGHRRLTKFVPAVASMLLLAGAVIGLLVLVAWQVVGSAAELSDDMPRLIDRAQALFHEGEHFILDRLPPWLIGDVREVGKGEAQSINQLRQAAGIVAAAAAAMVTEAGLVGIYLVFFLVEAERLPRRIESAFSEGRAADILAVVGNVNSAMADYLHVKVKTSLVLALPAMAVLAIAGVRFALMWGLLTFLLNFIPYLGSVIACSGPIVLAFLQMDTLGPPTVVALLLISIHMLSAYVVEPSMTGKAIGLSPVVILVALSFWGLCWGITGMLLAVPLTVLVKILLENVAFTRPVARLMAED